MPRGLDEPSFKIFCCLWAKVLHFVNVFARHAGLSSITLASGFMERCLSVSCRNCGKLVAHGIGFFSVCFFCNLKRTELFGPYIDYIFFISFGFSNTKSMQTALTNILQNNGLTLTFREVNNRQTGKGVEFLDVFHQIEEDDPIGFVAKNFTKPTAAGRTFLHGNSYHLLHIFKGIIFSDAVRLRRLNERQEDYINSINELKDKCLSSGLNKKVTQIMIQKVSTWTERF